MFMLWRKKQPSEVQNVSPYLNAKTKWNDRIDGVFEQKRIWQCIAILSMIINIGAVAGLIHIGSQSKFIPFVVQVDKLGQAIGVMQADRARPVDQRVLHATLASFIADARLVSTDVALQRGAIFRLYSMLNANDPATMKMNEWLNADPKLNPFKRSETELVSTEIISVIPQTKETWQIEWRETARKSNGILKEEYIMRALVTFYVVPPTSATTIEQIRRNPLGIYVKNFDWSKIRNQ